MSATDMACGRGERLTLNPGTFIRARGPELKRLGTTLLTINHVTMKVGAPKGANPETQPGGKKLRFANAIEVYFNMPLRNPKDTDKPQVGLTFRARTTKNKTAPAFRRAYVYVRTDDFFGIDVSAELAGMTDKAQGVETPGLLKDMELLLNKNGDKYAAGGMYYRDAVGDLMPVEYKVSGGMQQANSKASLYLALQQAPVLRAYLIGEVQAAIAAENSVEAIMQALRDGTLRMQGSEPVDAESDEAFEEVPDDYTEYEEVSEF
jgi:RecA/RadA recombinase